MEKNPKGSSYIYRFRGPLPTRSTECRIPTRPSLTTTRFPQHHSITASQHVCKYWQTNDNSHNHNHNHKNLRLYSTSNSTFTSIFTPNISAARSTSTSIRIRNHNHKPRLIPCSQACFMLPSRRHRKWSERSESARPLGTSFAVLGRLKLTVYLHHSRR